MTITVEPGTFVAAEPVTLTGEVKSVTFYKISAGQEALIKQLEQYANSTFTNKSIIMSTPFGPPVTVTHGISVPTALFATMPTFEALETEVRRLAAENPTYMYPRYMEEAMLYGITSQSCTYTQHGPKPACLFGQALMNLGVPAEVLHNVAYSISTVLQALQIPATTSQMFWADRVQSAQDSPRPWAEAVANGDRQRAELYSPTFTPAEPALASQG